MTESHKPTLSTGWPKAHTASGGSHWARAHGRREIIERLVRQNKTDVQICKNYELQEMVEEKRSGVENLEEKVQRIRRVIEGRTGAESEADQAFKALSHAMSVLSDTQKRRAYDSKDSKAEIDDSLPADKPPKDLEQFLAIVSLLLPPSGPQIGLPNSGVLS